MVVKSTIDAQLLQHDLDYLVKMERENGKSFFIQTNVASYLSLEMENLSNLATKSCASIVDFTTMYAMVSSANIQLHG
jgi:hypothetical protein